jgi:hypothetical protein
MLVLILMSRKSCVGELQAMILAFFFGKIVLLVKNKAPTSKKNKKKHATFCFHVRSSIRMTSIIASEMFGRATPTSSIHDAGLEKCMEVEIWDTAYDQRKSPVPDIVPKN